MIQFKSLQNVTIDVLAHTFNEAFATYFVPINFTPELLALKFKTENIKLKFSVGAFDDHKLVGFILHGFDVIDGKPTLYNGGTGVLKEYRGQQLTKKMYDYALNYLVDDTIDEIVLEVFDVNVAALKTYEALGFIKNYKVYCFNGCDIKINNVAPYIINDDVKPDWALYKTFWEIMPTWQNGIAAVNRIADKVKFIEVIDKDVCVGYAVFNPLSGRIYQIATKQNWQRNGIATLMLAYVGTFSKQISVTNVAEQSDKTIAFFNKLLGNTPTIQIKMTKTLHS